MRSMRPIVHCPLSNVINWKRTFQLMARINFQSKFCKSPFSPFSYFLLRLWFTTGMCLCYLLLRPFGAVQTAARGSSDVQLVLWVWSLGFGLIKYSLLTSKQEIKARLHRRGGRLQCSWQTEGLKEEKHVKRFALSQ